MLKQAQTIPKTFAGIYDLGVSGRGWSDPWHFATNCGSVFLGTKPPKWKDIPEESVRAPLLAKFYRDKGLPLQIVTTDRPGLTKNPTGGKAQGGGGLTVHVNSPSRVRAIHFTLGFQGTGLQTRATQILETQGGVPTICKFITTGIDDTALENLANHARWRSQINLASYTAPGNGNFDL